MHHHESQKSDLDNLHNLSHPSVSAPTLVKRKLIDLPYRSASFNSDTITTKHLQEKAIVKIAQPSKREIGKLLSRAEAITVLVGATDFLTKPVVAFVRLAHSQTLGNMTEVPLPVKFLFIMLGPQNCPFNYHEVGRAVATLMNNKVRLIVLLEYI